MSQDIPHNCAEGGLCVICETREYIQSIKSLSRDECIYPPLLKRLATEGHPFGRGQQEDAHDFLRYFLDVLHSGYLAGFERDPGYRIRDSSPIFQLFGGYLQSQIQCAECSGVSNHFESVMDLSLEISQVTETIEEMLQAYTKPERMTKDNKYKCESCQKDVTALKRFAIRSSPNILVLHLKRFNFQNAFVSKIDRYIEFPSSLKLSRFMTQSDESNAGGLYKLFAVLVHLGARGSVTSGHYITFVKDWNSSAWFCVDDEKVYPVPQETVMQQNAYMLFYTQTTPCPLPGWDSSKLVPLEKAHKKIQTMLNKGPVATKASKDEPILCIDGCGFYGSPETQGRCSLCDKRARGVVEVPVASDATYPDMSQPSMEQLTAQLQYLLNSRNAMVPPTSLPKQNPQVVLPPEPPIPINQQPSPRLGRNENCPCGSGKKYKKCHGAQ
eukprot:c4614_g1_i2.p1 GENE.c4614_g1_i2~~c4614_g1_i2.p1  ORF type:complete len:441 (-),score=87.84 c4614_g1_i2:56-1378(-)